MSKLLKNSIMMLKGAIQGSLRVASAITASAVFAFVLIPSYAGAATVTETFEGFSCAGAWVARPPGPNGTQSYVRDCGNGWTAFAEDTRNPVQDPPNSGPVGNQNVVALDSGANGPSVASSTNAAALLNTAPDGTPRGVLWLLKSYAVQSSAVIQTLRADVRLKLDNNTSPQYYGIVVFDGIVTDPSGPVDNSNHVPLRADTLGAQLFVSGSTVTSGDACNGLATGSWCVWQTVNMDNKIIIPSTTSTYITVGFRVEDLSASQISFGELDNLTVSGVQTAAGSPLAATDIAQRWKATYSASGTDNMAEAADVVIDGAGNAYVTGNQYLNGRYVVVTNKYDDTGALQWSKNYGGGIANYAVAIARGPAGDLYVISRRYNATGNYDWIVLKYAAADGTLAWQALYSTTGQDDVPTGLVVDGNGAYVTGSACDSSGCHYVTISLAPTDGSLQWDDATTNEGKAAAVKLDGSGNVYVTGTSSGNGDDIVTVKYTSAGVQQWAKRYDSGWDERATALAVDSGGYSYISGLSYDGGSPSIVVLKYDSSGVLQWAENYSGSFAQTIPSAIALDGSGNVYITGKTGRVLDHYILTVKYNSDGSLAWAHTFGNAGLDDAGVDIAVDGAGYVFVLGSLSQNPGNSNFVTLKYDAAGNAVAAITYDGFTTKDTPVALALGTDSQGDTVPYVTGTSVDLNGLDQIATVRYEKTRPDLTPTSISGPATAVVGNSITISDTVQNIDSIPLKKHADSGSFDVAFYLASATSGLPDLDNLILLDTRTVSNLTPGQSSSASTAVTVPNVAEGQYFLVTKADPPNPPTYPNGVVAEQDETNNTLVSTGTIVITSDKPDLTVTNFSGPGSISRDSAFNVNVAVKNIATPAAGPFRIGIYLSTDTTIDGSDVLIGQQNVSGGLGGLGTGLEDYSATISATVSSNPSDPNYANTGTGYYLGVIVDDLGAVNEANENNNTAVGQGIGYNTLLTTFQDFMVGSGSLSGTSQIGEGTKNRIELGHAAYAWTFTGAWDVPDIGSRAAPVLVDLNGDAKLDILIGEGGGTTYGYRNIGSLGSPSWTPSASWNVSMPASPCSGLATAPGGYARPAVADMNGDGIPDLLMIGYYNGICAFQNSGNTVPPTWVRQSSWDVATGTLPTRPPLLNKYNAPTLGDLDNDGLPDLLVGQQGSTAIYAYKNTGTKTAPAWTYTSAWNYAVSEAHVKPALVYLSGNFLIDFLYGSNTDNVVKGVDNYGGGFYVPTWHRATYFDVPAASDNHLVPTFGDLDNDGRLDILIGHRDGTTFGVRNTGAFTTSGTYTSKVVDSGSHGTYTTLSYATVKPSGTTLTVDVRAGDSTTAGDSTWTTWYTAIASGGDISFLGSHRYIQYRANLATTNTSKTPALYSIQAGYSPGPGTTAVSVVVGGGDSPGGGGDLSVIDLLLLSLAAALGGGARRRRGRAAGNDSRMH